MLKRILLDKGASAWEKKTPSPPPPGRKCKCIITPNEFNSTHAVVQMGNKTID